MEERKNAGYTIVQSLMIGNTEFVIGHHPAAPAPYVTWECKDGNNFYWGHYMKERHEADRDLLERAKLELDRQDQYRGRKAKNQNENGKTIRSKQRDRGDAR